MTASAPCFPRIRWAAAAWLGVYLPAYALAYGFANFLFLCNLSVILVAIGLWTCSRLLLSSQAVAVLLVGTAWTADFAGRLLLGRHLFGGTEYMWDPQWPLFTRLLSLYHVLLPLVLVFALRRLGYDGRGYWLQSAIAVVAVPLGERVEELGMERTGERLAQADLALYLVDGSEPLHPEDRQALAELAGGPGLAVINKIDLPQEFSEEDLKEAAPFPVVRISAITGAGLPALKQAIFDLAMAGAAAGGVEILTQARHQEHLKACRDYLNQARKLLGPAPPLELVALELREAVRELGELTGQEVGEDVLDRIFGEFCIGK